MNAGGVGGVDPLNWYNEIPIVSKVYLTLSFLTTAACALDLISPFSLYFNYKLIVTKGQVRYASQIHIPVAKRVFHCRSSAKCFGV